MNVALCVWWSVAIVSLSFYVGRRCGWLDERHRCASIADKAAAFCQETADRPPKDEHSVFWATRAHEARLIADKIRNSSERRSDGK